MKSTIVIAALVASALGVSSVVPTLAQDAPNPPTPPAVAPSTPAPPAATTPDTTPKPMHRFARKGGGMGGMDRGDRLVALACSDKGAEMLQRVLDRTAQRLDLTTDQQKLYDTFREKALTTETSFADQCQAARPDRSKGRPDLITHLQSQLAIDQARITALSAVLPDLQALFNTLSDQQKAQLRPNLMGMGRPGGQDGMGPNGDMGRNGGMGRDGGKPHHWGSRDGGSDGASAT